MPSLHHFRAAAERVYSAIFDEELRYVAGHRDQQHLADQLTKVFKESMIQRIEAALRGEEDPLRKVVEEARARKTKPAKESNDV